MKINQLKAGVILSYISMGIGTVVSIVYTPIMLRLLGQSEYGLYTLVGSVVSYLSLLSLGFGSSYVRYYSRYKVKNDNDGIAKLNGMFMTVFIIIGIVALIAGGILTLFTGDIFKSKLLPEEIQTAKILMAVLVFNIAISFPFSVFTSYITANEQYFFQRILSIVKVIANPFIVLPILFMGYKSVGLVVATVILNISIEILYMVYCLKKLKMKFNFKSFDFSLLKDIAIFSSFIFINIIVDQINWNVDKFLLGIYSGSIGVAVYGLASQLNTYYMQFSGTISSVFIPRVHSLVSKENDNKTLTEIFTKVGRIQFIVLSLIATGLIFFGKPFILKWGGADYANSYAICLVLIIPATLPLIQNLGIEIQRAQNLHKFRSWVYLFIAVINVLISIPLCKLFDGLGCAIGTAISLLIGNGLIMNIYYHKKCNLDMVYFWKNIIKFIPSLVIPSICGILINCFVDLNNIFNLVLFIMVYCIVFIISMWFMGLNTYEKDLFIKPINKLLRKSGIVNNEGK
ncbi:MAG: oligosaccharide flippase family protein [Oscillospiraceae bacterium]